MPLTPTQQKFVLDRLNVIWPLPRKCPACTQPGPWAIGTVCELREFNQGSLVVGGPVTPLVSVSCSNCGATQLFNAIRLGVVDPQTGQYTVG